MMDETDFAKKNKLSCDVSLVLKFDLLDLFLHFYD
jgi:hypothetical protein